jgi:hypothetical protein
MRNAAYSRKGVLFKRFSCIVQTPARRISLLLIAVRRPVPNIMLFARRSIPGYSRCGSTSVLNAVATRLRVQPTREDCLARGAMEQCLLLPMIRCSKPPFSSEERERVYVEDVEEQSHRGPTLSGHPKTGQRDETGDSVVLSCRLLWWQVYCRTPTPGTTFEYMTVIEHGGDGGAISQ